jgi:MFS family permease
MNSTLVIGGVAATGIAIVAGHSIFRFRRDRSDEGNRYRLRMIGYLLLSLVTLLCGIFGLASENTWFWAFIIALSLGAILAFARGMPKEQ